MGQPDGIARHYGRPELERAILEALRAAGKDPDRLAAEDLAPVDEFHSGGNEATAALLEHLALPAGARLLDLGAGIGGPARYLARKLNCRVDGIDLTPEFVAVARSLTARVGLADRVTFHLGSILALPFPAASFAAATLLHVGMNIADKPAVCAEAARVLVPGGVFVVYDVMRTAPGDPAFPVPWASRATHSFLATPDAYRAALAAAGLLLVHERERRAFALDFFARLRARGATAPPPLGTHLLMGADAATKIANFVAALHAGLLAPVEMIARKPV